MDDIEAKLATLRAYEKKREELSLIIDYLRRDLGLVGPEDQAVENAGAPKLANMTAVNVIELVNPGAFYRKSRTQAVRALLELTHQPVALRDIAQALYRGNATKHLIEGAKALRNLSSILSRSSEFVSVTRGLWGLVEWYPDRGSRRARRSREDVSSASEKDVDDA